MSIITLRHLADICKIFLWQETVFKCRGRHGFLCLSSFVPLKWTAVSNKVVTYVKNANAHHKKKTSLSLHAAWSMDCLRPVCIWCMNRLACFLVHVQTCTAFTLLTVWNFSVRPKSAEPVIPVAKSEHKSPKRTRPRAPRDLPVHGHGDLSGRKKAYKQSKTEYNDNFVHASNISVLC